MDLTNLHSRQHFRHALNLIAVLAAVVALSCTDESVTPVAVSSVEVSPAEETLNPGQTLTLEAVVRDASGNVLSDRRVEWSSDNAEVASVDEGGVVEAHAAGTATITASSEEVTGTAVITVETRPTIVLSDTSVAVTAEAGGSEVTRTIEVTTEGDETLTDLSVAVSYPEDGPEGWLDAGLEADSTTGVLLVASPGELSPGTYTAEVEVASEVAANSPQIIHVTFEVVLQLDPEADPATSTIQAGRQIIVADGSSTSVITVTLRNAEGDALEQGGDDVTLATTAGTLSGVTDNGDGTYTDTLTSSTTPGTATITGTVNGEEIADDATVEFRPGGPTSENTTIEADPNSIVADGSSASTITVTVKDANGNVRTAGGDTVALAATAGELSDVTDNADGTYTATLTATAAGTATITGTVNGDAIEDDATVEFTVGGASGATSTITADPRTVVGAQTSTITVQLLDAHDNPLTAGGDDVELVASEGTLEPAQPTDNGDEIGRAHV